MSNEIEIDADGVRVRKWFETEQFPVPAVAFEIVSERDDSVVVGLVDDVPSELAMDQVGFHPDYHSDRWTAHPDNRVEFEREFAAGDSITTVYGVRLDGDDGETLFSDEPELRAVPIDEFDGEIAADSDGGDTISDIAPPERTEVVREVIGGERDTVPGLEDDETAPDGEEDGEDPLADPLADDPVDAGDAVLGGDDPLADEAGGDAPAEPSAEEEGVDETAADAAEGTPVAPAGDDAADEAEFLPEPGPADVDTGNGGAETSGDEPASADDTAESDASDTEPEGGEASVGTTAVGGVPGGGDPVAELAAAIREGDADEEDLATVRDALSGVPRSTETRIEHLQTRVSDLEAYSDAIEAFVDEEGTAREALADVREELDEAAGERDAVRGDVADVEERVDGVDAAVADVEDELEGLADDVADVEESLSADLDRLRGDLEALEERLVDVEGVDEEVADLEATVADVEEDIEELDSWRDQLSDVFGGA